ncbi:hypothetical protein D0C17_18945 [Vibrio cholerae]|nr:hypothetical protein [Vibrio cholerae]
MILDMPKYKECEMKNFHFDVESREIIFGDKVIKLNYNESLLLDYMIRNDSKILNKQDLIKEGWPGTCVTDSSLHKSISKLRSILEVEEVATIETITGRGYVFRHNKHRESVASEDSKISILYIVSIFLCLLSAYFFISKNEDGNYISDDLRILHLDDGVYKKEIVLASNNALSQLAIDRIHEYQCSCTFFYMTLSAGEQLSIYHLDKHEVENLIFKRDMLE